MAKKGRGIFLVYTDVDPMHEGMSSMLGNTEHLPELLSLPGFLMPHAMWHTRACPGIWRCTRSTARKR
jgi:hypothetical protein